MSRNRGLGELSTGNVISAGLRIYRDHFKMYYTIALQSSLWFIVPIYGWAKGAALLGLISRLAYHEVIEKPESLPDARRHINPRMWVFLGSGMLVGLIFLASLIVGIVLISIVLGVFFSQGFQNDIPWLIFSILFSIIIFIVFIVGYVWLFSRLALYDLAIAIEGQNDSTKSIARSWTLSEGYVGKLQQIFFITFLITIPIGVINQFSSVILQAPQDAVALGLVFLLINLVINIAVNALLIPFWQSIKAVIYYDLRLRKEGIDLDIRTE